MGEGGDKVLYPRFGDKGGGGRPGIGGTTRGPYLHFPDPTITPILVHVSTALCFRLTPLCHFLYKLPLFFANVCCFLKGHLDCLLDDIV